MSDFWKKIAIALAKCIISIAEGILGTDLNGDGK